MAQRTRRRQDTDGRAAAQSAAPTRPTVANAAAEPDGTVVQWLLAATAVPSPGSGVPAVGEWTEGWQVTAPLYRQVARLTPPALEGGVAVVTALAESLGELRLRLCAVEEGVDVARGQSYAVRPLEVSASQRLVCDDGVLAVGDGATTLRFFATGRSHPAVTDGRARWLFSAGGAILEGTGALAGARGQVLIVGEGLAGGHVDCSVLVRLEGAAISSADIPPVHVTSAPTAMASVVWQGRGAGAALSLSPWLVHTAVRRDGTVAADAYADHAVGHIEGGVTTPPGTACGVPLDGGWTWEFVDAVGRPVGSLRTLACDGSAVASSGHARGAVAYGAVSGGTGALQHGGGVMALVSLTDADGTRTVTGLTRLVDPDGRWTVRPAVAAEGTAPTAAAHSAAASTTTTAPEAVATSEHAADAAPAVDPVLAALIEPTLEDGRELLRWWRETESSGTPLPTFDVVRPTHDVTATGFTGTAPVRGRDLPVLGVVQETLFDHPKGLTRDQVEAQVRAFALEYVLRASHMRAPSPAAGAGGSGSRLTQALSWHMDDAVRHVGFGYTQVLYKEQETGRVAAFAAADQHRIVDLRELGTRYAWVVLRVEIFDFTIAVAPLGGGAPSVHVPMKEVAYLVMAPDFIETGEAPAPDGAREFGFGYAFIPYAPDGPEMLAYGPGHFAAAIKTVRFRVTDDGAVRVRALFLANRPTRIMSVDLDPLGWSLDVLEQWGGRAARTMTNPMRAMSERWPLRAREVDPIGGTVDLANRMTGGRAADALGMSREVLERRMLWQHFQQHHELFRTARVAWQAVPDWTTPARIPDRWREGESW